MFTANPNIPPPSWGTNFPQGIASPTHASSPGQLCQSSRAPESARPTTTLLTKRGSNTIWLNGGSHQAPDHANRVRSSRPSSIVGEHTYRTSTSVVHPAQVFGEARLSRGNSKETQSGLLRHRSKKSLEFKFSEVQKSYIASAFGSRNSSRPINVVSLPTVRRDNAFLQLENMQPLALLTPQSTTKVNGALSCLPEEVPGKFSSYAVLGQPSHAEGAIAAPYNAGPHSEPPPSRAIFNRAALGNRVFASEPGNLNTAVAPSAEPRTGNGAGSGRGGIFSRLLCCMSPPSTHENVTGHGRVMPLRGSGFVN